jgi:hypothetical protein
MKLPHSIRAGMLAPAILLAGALASSLLIGSPAAGARSPLASLVFADGFESGDTCAWAASCPAPADVSGTWVGALELAGERPLALELRQRADGSLLGYLLGTSSYRTMVTGSYAAGELQLELELANREGARELFLAGPVSGDTVVVAVTGDVAPHAAVLHRVSQELHERRFMVVAPELFNAHLELGVLLDEAGLLVAGGWVGTCELWGCEGWLAGFEEAAGVMTLELDDESGCAAGSTALLTFDADFGAYLGSFTFHQCGGTQSGSLLAARATGTRTSEAAEILAGLAGIADQLAAREPFTAPHPAFAPDYQHNGVTLAALFGAINDEIAAHAAITQDFVGIRTISTADPGEAFPMLRQHRGVELDEVRTGDGTTLRDSRGDRYYQLQGNAFRVWEPDPGGWRVAGNRQPELDLPFDYEVIPGSRELRAPTATDPVWITVGGYGAHVSPLTGHPAGDAKANLMGFLPKDDSEMVELVGNGDGIRQEGEIWGYWGGVDGERIRDRNVPYRARHAGRMERIELLQTTTVVPYFDDVPHWEVRLRHDNGLEMDIGHLGSFPAPFAARVLAATGCNPNDLATCPGVGDGDDLLDGLPPLEIAPGEAFALPQILADELPPSADYPPGHYVGGGGNADYPWAQIEYTAWTLLPRSTGSVCAFRLLTPERQAAVAAVMHLDMIHPESRRYVERFAAREWGWRGESALCNAETIEHVDFRNLDTQLGGWYQRDEPGTTADEVFAIFPIATDSAVYDPALYHSPDVSQLALRIRAHGVGPFSWTMPDASIVSPFYPLAEVLERTESALLLKWRDIGYTPADLPVYQRAAFLLDENGLKIAWGAFANTPGAAVLPVLTGPEPCDDLVVLCYDHTIKPGF